MSVINWDDSHTGERPLKIAHVIGSLDVGGAERALCGLITSLADENARMKIITLIPGGPLAGAMRREGVRVESLSMRRGRPNPLSIVQLARHLRRDRPDLVVTWMYHANLVGGLASRLAGGIPVVWNIRHTSLHPDRSKRLTRWIARAGASLSGSMPRATVYVAEASRRHHQTQGFDVSRSAVIPNGFDTTQFRPDADAPSDVRAELGIPRTAPLVGLIGRFHPDKDHHTFLQAASHLRRQRPETQFVLCGDGVTYDNAQLALWVSHLGLTDRVHLLGNRADVPRLAAAFDLSVSSSATEAFPRAIGESMACGVPCVVTDVGDAAHLVGDTGRVVPPGDAQALATACETLLQQPTERRALGRAARRRIAEEFSLPSISQRHLALWRQAAGIVTATSDSTVREYQAA